MRLKWRLLGGPYKCKMCGRSTYNAHDLLCAECKRAYNTGLNENIKTVLESKIKELNDENRYLQNEIHNLQRELKEKDVTLIDLSILAKSNGCSQVPKMCKSCIDRRNTEDDVLKSKLESIKDDIKDIRQHYRELDIKVDCFARRPKE